MTDLTGIPTSTGLPLGPSLQHNEAAMQALTRLRAKEAAADSAAYQAGQELGVAEHVVESIRIRIRSAEQRAQQWQHAAAGLPELVRSEMPPPAEVDELRGALTDAEAELREAQREHAQACAVLRDAHNAAEGLKRHIYAPSADPIEVG